MAKATKPRYTIIEADGADQSIARILRDLHSRIFDDTAPQIEPQTGFWWLAFLRDEPAGFAGLKISQRTPGTGYLHRAGVLRQHRGNGLQRRFIRVREAKARALGMDRIVTDTTDNIPSANSLIACHYRLYMPEGPWGFSDTLYWERTIA